ncbi:MAG: fasciclin domain-containing protein [Silvanigrellales bacterium]|nr:fasciclin domain-containing protein [Silvanigrellales bacterium]
MRKNLIATTTVFFALVSSVALGQASGTTGTDAATGASLSGTETTAQPSATKDIVDTAVAAGNFTTLQKALTEAGLVETLKGAGPFTVFAPTDAAFAKVPKKQLAALLANKELLGEVLKHHVVSGNVKAADVIGLKTAQPLGGGDIAIKVRGKGDKATVTVGGKSKVTTADIAASNGVIHVIDNVMIPADIAKKLR